MKKLLAFVMAAAMTLSLAACGGGSSSSAGTSTPAGTSSAPAASSTPADTADFKVGAIYINGQNDTAGYTFQHHSGITKAMENLGLDPASQLLIVDNVAEDYTAVSNAIDTLAGQGANIIFGISFGYIDAMNDKAESTPRSSSPTPPATWAMTPTSTTTSAASIRPATSPVWPPA